MVESPTSNYLKAATLKLAAAFLFAAMAVQVRFLGAKVPVGQVIFFRAVFAIIPIVIVFAWRGELAKSWHTQRFSAHVYRGAISIASSFCYYGALARLPVVDTTAISFVTPLMTVALAAVSCTRSCTSIAGRPWRSASPAFSSCWSRISISRNMPSCRTSC